MFLNELFSTLKSCALFNFAVVNTISADADDVDYLVVTLKHESEQAIRWFVKNQMIVNQGKFQTMILRIDI